MSEEQRPEERNERPLTDEEYEQISRRFWSQREPGYDTVTVIVRRGGVAVRTIRLDPPTNPAAS